MSHAAQNAQNRWRPAFWVRLNLPFDLQQVLRCGVDLVGPQFDLKGAPLAVRQFDHRVDLLIFVVLIVIEMRSEGLGINSQIPLAQSLKKETQSFQIPQQPGRRGLQQGAGQRRVGKVPLLRLLHPHRRADAREEGRLIVCNKQPLEDIQISRHVSELVAERLIKRLAENPPFDEGHTKVV